MATATAIWRSLTIYKAESAMAQYRDPARRWSGRVWPTEQCEDSGAPEFSQRGGSQPGRPRRSDLQRTHISANTVFVVLSNPEGGFGAPTPYQVGSGTRSVVSTDINGDGKLDLISSSFDTGTISLLLGDGDGGFNQQMSLPVFDAPSLIATGDFDQDGRIDLAIPRGGALLSCSLTIGRCVVLRGVWPPHHRQINYVPSTECRRP